MRKYPFRFITLLTVVAVACLLMTGHKRLEAAQPNILIIMADDCTYNDLPVYGGKNARTPHIDSLAKQGLVFNQAYLASAMCQPCRAELFSGQYPMRNGCAWNHSASRSSTKSLPQHLGKHGYRVGIAGKVHVKPEAAFPFENVAGFDKNCVRNPTQEHQLGGVRKFMTREPGQPFCLVVALVEPHVPWVMGDASQYPPGKIQLPPNLADTAGTREAYGRYLAEMTYMDSQVGEILKTLKDSGHDEDTLVLFTSEQGSQFPGCKWTNWNTGVHTALIARWPGHVPVGKRTNALVQYADVVPTLLEAAGENVPLANLDGNSFLDVLTGKADKHRQYVYHTHNNLPEGPAYPVRAVGNGRYRYVRNLTPNELFIEKHLMGWQGGGRLNNPYWLTWVNEAWKNPQTYMLVKRYMQRPAEQLYDITQDPYELNNLVGHAGHEKIHRELSTELDRWLQAQGDPGIPQDTDEALQAARRNKHLYGPRDVARKREPIPPDPKP